MVNFITPPVLKNLLPVFLAHVPTAFTSSQPPPSLYPLLSPIIRQRIHHLAPARTTTSGVEESWLTLLTWSATAGPKLSAHLATQDFIPHPSSGELEVGETNLKGFQRQDKETIKTCVELLELDIEVTYIWIGNDPDGEDDGWKIQDVRLTEDSEEQKWYPTVGEADQAFCNKTVAYITPAVYTAPFSTASQHLPVASEGEGENDDYWDMYDRTPARTPMAPQKKGAPSEESYYARYGNVQPALEPEPFSTTPPNPTTIPLNPQPHSPLSTTIADIHVASRTPPPALQQYFIAHKDDNAPVTHAPRPISVASSSSSTRESIARLEENAEIHVQSELAVKQHISSTIKSLYRLSRAAGIKRDEFERMLQTEVAVLSMMEDGNNVQTW